jgi:hypothetical protein
MSIPALGKACTWPISSVSPENGRGVEIATIGTEGTKAQFARLLDQPESP